MLKNEINETTWFYDLEWVPDAAAARRVLGMTDETSEADAIEALWRSADTTGQIARPFVKHLFSRVVSISFLSRRIIYRDGVATPEFAIHSLPKLPFDGADADEAYLIERFLHYVGEREPHLVGYNSADSDIQVLIQRGLVHEITAAKFCSRPDKPWEGRDYFVRYGEYHLDIMKLFSSGSMKPKLNEIARLCGFPGKIDIDGEQVVDLWLQGDIPKIIEYNQLDTLNTYLVWLRLVLFCGKISEEDYAVEQDIFRDFLYVESEKPHMQHIGSFLDSWN